MFCNDSERSLAKHIMQAYPEEGCGLLLGRADRIEKIKPVENMVAGENGSTYFKIDPLTVYKEECAAQKEGMDVIGFYHSHPDKRAVMSKADEEYMIPEMLYIIVSVSLGKVREIRAYHRKTPDEKVTEAEIAKEAI